MNICLLPDELLVNIVDRLDFHSVESVRLVSRRFHYLVNRYDLSRPIADSVKFVGSYQKEGGEITVTATLDSKDKIVKEKWSCQVSFSYNTDYTQIHKNLGKLVREFPYSGTEAVLLENIEVKDFNVLYVLYRARIDFDALEAIRTEYCLNVPFVNGALLERLMAKETNVVNFCNCITSLTFDDILRCLTIYVSNVPTRGYWHFGKIYIPLKSSSKIKKLLENGIHKLKYHVDDEKIRNHTIYNGIFILAWQQRIQCVL